MPIVTNERIMAWRDAAWIILKGHVPDGEEGPQAGVLTAMPKRHHRYECLFYAEAFGIKICCHDDAIT
jgi:hypothetical protein